MEEGLSHNYATKAIEDEKGFIWIATRDGLNRFDGHAVKKFDIKRPGTELSEAIYSLSESRDGNIWVGTQSGLFLFDTDAEVCRWIESSTPDGHSIDYKVVDIASGSGDDIWVAVYSRGVFRYNYVTGALSLYCQENGKLSVNEVLTLCFDHDGMLWAGTIGFSRAGLSRYDETADTFVHYDGLFTGGVSKIIESRTNDLLICSMQSGLNSFNRVTEKVETLFSLPGEEYNFNDILEDGEDIWIGSSEGLYLVKRNKGKVSRYYSSFVRDNSLTSNDITSILKDHWGGLWFCTGSKGVNYLPANWTDFELYPSSPEQTSSLGRIRHFAKDASGKIWFVSDSGLSVFNPEDDSFNGRPLGNLSLSGAIINLIDIYGDKLFVGYMGRGLDEIDLGSRTLHRYPCNYSAPNNLGDNSIISLCRDAENNLIVGTTKGANIIRDDRRMIDELLSREHRMVSDVLVDANLNYWLSCDEEGVFIYNPRNRSMRHLRHHPGGLDSLHSNSITGLFLDSRSDVWLFSEGSGLCRYDHKNARFQTFTTEDGLPNNTIQKVLEDDSGRIWISTNDGLCCYNPDTGTFTGYSFSGGPLSNQFVHHSGIKDDHGYLYFGTIEGFVRFHPESLKPVPSGVPIYFTDLTVGDQPAAIGGKDAPLEHSIVNASRITLRHDQNTFRLTFSSPGVWQKQAETYRYKLEKYDSDWITAHNNQIVYSNLPVGRYSLVVATAARGADATSKRIEILVKPSPWGSVWARLGYAVLLLVGILFGILSLRRRQRDRRIHLQEELASQEEKALYDTKLAFFTGIAHEIRTPLSLISGPFEMLSSSDSSAEMKSSCMEVMGENIRLLGEMVRQMLDLSVIEQDGFILSKTPTDVGQLLEPVLQAWRVSLQKDGVHLSSRLSQQRVVANVDREQFLKIISNLLSNAAKYCKSQIRVTLEGMDDHLRLTVWNDGSPLAPDLREKVFESFFQAPDGQRLGGVGIGLSLVRRFSQMHGGRAYVDPDMESGTAFVVELPFGDLSDAVPEPMTEPAVESEEPIRPSGRNTILIVDNDKGMTRFLKKILQGHYAVVTAESAATALSVLRSSPVDLVISDVMMSDMDGIALCKILKSQDEFRHIPIILLTARTDLKSYVAGMDAGADALLEKPFSPELLSAQIRNILRNRPPRFIQGGQTVIPRKLTAKNERFMTRLYDYVYANLSNPDLDIDVLCDEFHVSRSNLYRRIKETTGMSPAEFIKDARLKKASELLQGGEMRVGEVAFSVGYTSSSYFAKSFYARYGMLPKDFAVSYNPVPNE